MRRRPRRSRSAAKPSSENGGSSTALSPTASMRQETACSPSRACRRANGAACAPPTLSSVCTRNSSDGSRHKPFCRQPTPLRCCSGRCWPQDRSTCARSMVGRPSPQNQSISRLNLLPETILSCSRRMRQTEFQPHSGRHHRLRHLGHKGNELFELMCAFSQRGLKSQGDRTAGLAVLIYLFEICDVFEK